MINILFAARPEQFELYEAPAAPGFGTAGDPCKGDNALCASRRRLYRLRTQQHPPRFHPLYPLQSGAEPLGWS